MNHPLLEADEHYRPFVAWEKSCSDCIDFKRIYVDIAGDLTSGVLLAQIIYWFLPSKNGQPRIRVSKNNRFWLAKRRKDWLQECRISPKAYDRAIGNLRAKGIVVVGLHKFNNTPMHHISINWKILTDLIAAQGKMDINDSVKSIHLNGVSELSNEGKVNFDQKVKSLTESTSETTTEREGTASSPSLVSEEKDQPQPATENNHSNRDWVQVFVEKWNSAFPEKTATVEELSAVQTFVQHWEMIYTAGDLESAIDGCIRDATANGIPTIDHYYTRRISYFHSLALARRHCNLPPGKIKDAALKRSAYIIARWLEQYNHQRQRIYALDEMEITAVKHFAKINPDLDTSPQSDMPKAMAETIDLSSRTRPVEKWDDYFFCRKGGTLNGFLKHYQKILDELGF